MAKHLFIVASYAAAGQTAELDRWYDEQHIPDMLNIPGIVGARKYTTSPVKFPEGVPPPDAVTIYDFETDDPMAVLAEAGRRSDTPAMPFPAAIDRSRTIAFIATPQA